MFPGPGAVSVQNMLQNFSEQTVGQQKHTSYEHRVKRLKCDDARVGAHTEEESESGTSNQAKGSEPQVLPLDRVVFIDSTWNQTSKISTDERLQGNYGFVCAALQRVLTASDFIGK